MTLELNQDLEQMLISAERYAVGRRTYMVGATVDYITPLLPVLSDWCLSILQNDLERERDLMMRVPGSEPFGDKIDCDKWLGFMNDLSAEIKKRKGDSGWIA